MAGDGIKIVEFDDDGEGSPAARPGAGRVAGPVAGPVSGPVSDRGGKTGMKIVEFDNDRDEGRAAVATPENIGPVKIVEFDDEGPSGPPPRETPKAAPKAIKIRDFGAEAEAGRKGDAGSGSKIKVMEFDW